MYGQVIMTSATIIYMHDDIHLCTKMMKTICRLFKADVRSMDSPASSAFLQLNVEGSRLCKIDEPSISTV